MNKRLVLLVVLLFFSFLVMGAVQILFSRILKDESHIDENYLYRQVLASDLTNQIKTIQAQMYKVPLVSNSKAVTAKNMDQVTEAIEKAENMIALLEYGGRYSRTKYLNLPGINSYTETIKLDAPPNASEEVLHLRPQIERLKSKRRQLESLINQKLQARKNHASLHQISLKITLFYKSLDSIFRRMHEDANQLYYDAQHLHLAHSQKIQSFKRRYTVISYALLVVIVGLIFLLTRYFYRELQAKIRIDRLTGLGSRAWLEAQTFSDTSLLILIDMDDFSDINSLHGMPFGDTVLRNQADKLRHFSSEAEVFRVAGDVFGLYYPSYQGDDDAIEKKIHQIRAQLKDCSKCNMEISVTIGVARGKDCLHDAYTALDIANTKDEPWWIYHDESRYIREVKFNRLWHDELKSALDNDRITPFFQPIVDKEKHVIHYETLMRLKRTNGKTEYISPAVFLDVAKRTKLYLPISRRLIEKAFVFFSNKPDISFTINLSYEDMEKEQTEAFLEKMIEKYHARNRVVFEVLESSFIHNPELLDTIIARFRSLGVKFAIDDFGAGYSNLKRVIALNPDYLKIDGSLIQAMLHDRRSRKMVENIVEYAREFGIKTIAEYVSTPEIFSECQDLLMDYYQGYYFAKPSPRLELSPFSPEAQS